MSLLLLFQGGVQADIPPPPPPPPVLALDFLSHGDGAIGPAAFADVSAVPGAAVVGPGASTDIAGGAGTLIGPGPKTTIQ